MFRIGETGREMSRAIDDYVTREPNWEDDAMDYTPGPWRYNQSFNMITTDDEESDQLVLGAKLGDDGKPTLDFDHIKDMKLMAAAPELLMQAVEAMELLAFFVNTHDKGRKDRLSLEEVAGMSLEVYNKLYEVCSKAIGEPYYG